MPYGGWSAIFVLMTKTSLTTPPYYVAIWNSGKIKRLSPAFQDAIGAYYNRHEYTVGWTDNAKAQIIIVDENDFEVL